ncbi:hypothetical protein AB9M90_18555 [Bacillus safensis]|uniref:hypothetical protein n=2 Tax=Bacillus safensis TaxID=561879 RepID=UPI0035123C92
MITCQGAALCSSLFVKNRIMTNTEKYKSHSRISQEWLCINVFLYDSDWARTSDLYPVKVKSTETFSFDESKVINDGLPKDISLEIKNHLESLAGTDVEKESVFITA